MFTEEEVDLICVKARQKLANMHIILNKEFDCSGVSVYKDDLFRYWNILESVEYRKDFDNEDNTFQRLVLLLYSKLALENETFMLFGKYIQIQGNIPYFFIACNNDETAPIVVINGTYITVQPDISGTIDYTVTEGTNSAVSTVWSVVSGSATVDQSGNYDNADATDSTIKVVVTDSIGLEGEDTVVVKAAAAPSEARYTWSLSNAPLTEEQIEASTDVVEYTTGGNYIIPWQTETEAKFLLFFEKKTEPLKTKWQDTVNLPNNGNIGTEDDLFDEPYETATWRGYFSVYATITSYPIQIKIV